MKELKLRHYYGAGMILYTKDGNGCISVLLEKRFCQFAFSPNTLEPSLRL